MSEGKLTWVHVWKPEPGLLWRCYEGGSRIIVDAATKQEAIDEFNRVWMFRSPVEWRFEAPPQPKHRNEPKPASAAIEGDTDAVKFHRLVLRAFHPDLHGAKKRWSATEIVAAINQAWTDSTGAK